MQSLSNLLLAVKMSNEQLLEAITELEENSGLKKGFFLGLVAEDDWSFIIKIHALYEAAVSKLITERIGEEALEAFFSRLELGDKSRGKLRLAKDLGLLDEDERKFIYALSEIRNDFVHDVRNTNADLEAYFQGLDKARRNHFVQTFGYTYEETIQITGKTVNAKVFTKENPRIAIWQNSMHVLAVISCLAATENAKKQTKEASLKIHALLQNS